MRLPPPKRTGSGYMLTAALSTWGAHFLRSFGKKLRKRYNTSATPIDLLLYYGVGRQASFWPFLAPGLRDRSPWIQQRVDRGPFAAVWLYDAHAANVLARFAPSETPFIG
jgi:hypothetical protein